MCSAFKMDHLHYGRCHYVKPLIYGVLRRQEYLITYNRNSNFSITSKMHSHEETKNNKYAFIVEALYSKKMQKESFQVECVVLPQMVMNMVKSSTSTTSNSKLSIVSIVE
jgi:hypothetical protein